MEGPMVCYSMGVINSLIVKITPLIENHPMISDLLQDIKSLRDDHMNKLTSARTMGKQVKVWMKQSREMIYDIEDWIDLKQEVTNIGESDKKQINQFKDQIEKARDRYERYELLKEVPNSDAEPFCAGSRSSSEVTTRRLLWEEKIALVGIDGPKSELLNHLKNEQKELMVVSILGNEGYGKTVLAKEIYGDIYIRKQFECHAFVSAGRTISMRTTLIEILHQLKFEEEEEEEDWESWSCNEIITELWQFLRTKRYFICIDDIRNTQDSEAIICALPDKDLGSRILTTTCMEDIAKSCSSRPNDVVYQMKALCETDSKSLFCNCVYVQEEKWPDHFKETSNKLLKVCGGVAMAIIITAGFLGSTLEEFSVQSKKLDDSIFSELNKPYSVSQMMTKLLEISYADLPLPVRSCFLYLTAFSGNHDIKKDRLIRRWLAEGLIPKTNGKVPWETAESYFEELISRRLIQPTFDENDDLPAGCTVHGVVFDFMKSLSKEENFVTAGEELESGVSPYDKVRRVSLDYSDDDDEGDTLIFNTYCLLEEKSWVASSSDRDEAISLHLSRVRSLAFCGHAGRIPDLSAFRHIRVLDLEDTKDLENKQLESIGLLSLLRYLRLGGTNVTRVPEQIMALAELSSLNLRKNRVNALPQFRGTKLVSLLADQLIIPDGMGQMQELEELSKVLVGPDGSPTEHMAELVHGLRRLRSLGVRFSHLHGQNDKDRHGLKHFLEEVANSKLQSLVLDNYQHHLLDTLIGSWANKKSDHLKKFELRIGPRLRHLPQEIASLVALTHLHIDVEAVDKHVISALGKLPVLAVLKLYSYTSPSLSMSSKDGFKHLKVFWYNTEVFWYNTEYGGGKGVRFDAGAMPQLRRLRVDLDARKLKPKSFKFDIGIQHLPCLVHFHATIDWTSTNLTPSEMEAVEDDIRNKVSLYPNKPVLQLNSKMRRPVRKAAEELVIAVHNMEEWSKNIDPSKLVVIHFSTGWCKASRKMAPVFANLAGKFRNVVFLKVDVEANVEMSHIAAQFHVDGVPTFVFLKEGNDIDRVVGADEEELEEKLEYQVAPGGSGDTNDSEAPSIDRELTSSPN